MRLLQNSAFAALAWVLLCGLEIGCHQRHPVRAAADRPHAMTRGPDLLETQSKELAGPGAIDCGRVDVNQDPKPATKCALAAQKIGKPFRVRYELMGIDSEVAVGIVRTSIGTVGTLQYDSDVTGSGSDAHRWFRDSAPRPCISGSPQAAASTASRSSRAQLRAIPCHPVQNPTNP